MILLKDSEIDPNQWNCFFTANSYATPFQSIEYFKFFNSIPGLSANVFAVESDKQLQALCVVTLQKEEGIKGFFSRRGIIYGGPLVKGDNEEDLTFLLTKMISYYRSNLIYLEIRNYYDYFYYRPSFFKAGYTYKSWFNFHLDTTDFSNVKASMGNSRLRQVNKAKKNGVTWKVAESLDEVNQFYLILSNLYHDKIKKPIFSKNFFSRFFIQNLGKYLLVEYENKIIGGIMCPILENRVIYEFYVCGLDHEYKEQYPSVMATWAAIEYAYQHNIQIFDFMGAGSPNENYGVREFKARFGGKLVDHGRFLCVLNPFLYSIGKIGLKILSKLKS